jgi:FdhD protein
MPEGRITRDMEVLRWQAGSKTREPDVLAEEAMVTFHVEPLGILDIVMAPESLSEFIIGHLYCEGLIRDKDDVGDITVADRGGRLEVLVELGAQIVEEAERSGDLDGAHTRGLIQTECGAPPAWPTRPLSPIEGLLGMAADAVAGIPRRVRDRTELFVQTGAFHYAFLVSPEGDPVIEAFDVGRHTAVDKVVGRAMIDGVDPGSMALYTTGRISSDVARKCVHAHIPLVISRGAPLTRAIEIARENRLGMVGFLRGGRFNVYSGEGHVNFD